MIHPTAIVEPGARHSTSPETIAFVEAQKKHDPNWIERDVVLEEIDHTVLADEVTRADHSENGPSGMLLRGLAQFCRHVAVAFSDQPDHPVGDAGLTANGTWLAYLDVWKRHETPIDDPLMRVGHFRLTVETDLYMILEREELRRRLTDRLSTLQWTPRAAPGHQELSEEDEAALRALGYLD